MNSTKSIQVAFILLLGMLCINSVLLGQSTLGSISGTVKDATGAVLPDAQVALTNTETGHTQRTVTGADGAYNFRDVAVGTYSILVKSSGFASQRRTGLVLYANQALTNDIQMKVSSAQNTVEVSAAQSLIDTQNSDITHVLTGSSLLNMSLLTRQSDTGLYANFYYAPGVQDTESRGANNGRGDSAATPAINGARQLDSMITMDGMVVMVAANGLGATPIRPSYEAVQEIHTVLANAPAEFWRPAAITVVTKTGTNQFHGSLYYDYNGSALNARDYFSTSVPFRVENNFAASVGGPLKKNKLFFFGDYEGGRNIADDVVVGNVPPLDWRTGNFSSLSSPIINPYTGLAFAGNQIPPNLISSVSQYIQGAILPQPNFGPPGLLAGNYRDLFKVRGSGFQDYNGVDLSLQYILSKKDTLFLHDTYRKLPVNTLEGSLPTVGVFVENRIGADGVISENHVFSPTLINEARLGYTYMKLGYHQTYDGYSLLAAAGMQGPFTTFEPKYTNVPQFSITSISGTSLEPYGDNIGYDYEWNDNLSWSRGKHLMKFGVDQILDHIDVLSASGEMYGSYNFNGLFSGNGYADFLLGLPQQTAILSPPPPAQLHGTMLAAFAQDQFQVNQRLTLNYGLRWEYQGPYSGAPYEMYSFDPKNGAEVIQTQAGLSRLNPNFPSDIIPVETAAVAGYPRNSLLFSHYLNFYPRIGFAYRLFPHANTVLRGAYGVYGNNIYGNQAITIGNGGPFIGSATFINHNIAGTPLFSFPDPFLSSGTLATQTAQATDPNITVPYTQQWNLTIEHQLGSSVVTVAYVGAATRNILVPLNLNQPPPNTTPFSSAEVTYPNYNAVDWTVNAGVDNYNSFQASVRLSRGNNLFVDTGLTVAKDLTDAADTASFQGIGPENRFCLGCEYGRNSLTKRLKYYLITSYILPFGRDQKFLTTSNRWQNELVGGWVIAADSLAMSGEFFTPYVNSGFDTANTNTSFDQRADQIGNPHVSSRSINNWFNINAFGIPGCPTTDPTCKHSIPTDVGRFGNVKPGGLVGPGYFNVNLSLIKNFRITDTSVFQLRLTSQNAFNHPEFAIPDWKVTDGPGVAGVVTSEDRSSLGPREIDIIGRFQF